MCVQLEWCYILIPPHIKSSITCSRNVCLYVNLGTIFPSWRKSPWIWLVEPKFSPTAKYFDVCIFVSVYYWNDAISWSHPISSLQILTDTMDGPASNSLKNPSSSQWICRSGWSQYLAQRPGSFTEHSMDIRCVCVIEVILDPNLTSPHIKSPDTSRHNEWSCLNLRTIFPSWRRAVRIWLEPKSRHTARYLSAHDVVVRCVYAIEVILYPSPPRIKSWDNGSHNGWLYFNLRTPVPSYRRGPWIWLELKSSPIARCFERTQHGC